jgi:flagellar hook-length control protein FliK
MPNPAEQIKVQLSKGLKDGSDTINVQLHPEDLGRIEVKLELQGGQVKATVTADNAQTLQLLKGDAAQLQQALQDAGFSTDDNGLSFQLRGDQQPQGQMAQQGGSGQQGADDGTAAGSGLAATDAVAAASGTTGGTNGGVDISV